MLKISGSLKLALFTVVYFNGSIKKFAFSCKKNLMGATIFYSRLFKCFIDLFNRGILLDFSKSTLINTASSTALRSTVSEDARIEPRTVATLTLSQSETVVTRKRIIVYIEYQSVCSFVVIESPHPPPPRQACPPPP
jgi:hypothetical protein